MALDLGKNESMSMNRDQDQSEHRNHGDPLEELARFAAGRRG